MTGETYRFPCGCSFPVVGPPPRDGALPLIEIDPDRIEPCRAVWDLLATGRTKGVFQLESRLGQTWTRKLRPKSAEDMAGLAAVLRPGCLQVHLENGLSATENFCLRANGEVDWAPELPVIADLLEKTYGVLCIHEDAMVAMADGSHLPLKEVRAGQAVVSYDGVGGRFEGKPCLRVGPTRFGRGVRLVLKNRFSAVLTHDHEVLTQRGYVRCEQLAPDDMVAVGWDVGVERIGDELGGGWLGEPEDVGYLLGYLVGNGSTSQSVSACCGTEEKADVLAEWIGRRIAGMVVKKYFHTRSWYLGLSHPLSAGLGGNMGRLTKFHAWLKELGMKVPCLRKRIPGAVLRAGGRVGRAFLAGLFDADGYSGLVAGTHNVSHLCTGSAGLLEDIRHLCASHGVMTRIEADGKHIGVCNTARFWEVVGEHTLLRKPVGKLTDGNQYGWVQFDGRMTQYRAAMNRGAEDLPIRFVPVEQLEEVADQQFYGIDVADNRNLVTNGLVVHNCFQEQATRIAERVAGFDKVEQDELRKSIGKKNQELLARVGRKFVDKASPLGVITREQAEKLFGDIRKSGRYLFCQAHAQSYGLCGIDSAYIKAHVPVSFYASWLMHAKEKSDPRQEILELVSDARGLGVPVEPPDVRDLSDVVSTDGVGVRFGLADVRGAGPGQVEALAAGVAGGEAATGKPRAAWGWAEWLTFGLHHVKKNVAEAWLGCGAFRFTGMTRTRMAKEYAAYSVLNDRELVVARQHLLQQGRLVEAMKAYADVPRKEGGPNDARRRRVILDTALLLESGASSDDDHPNTIAGLEEHLLGVSLTCSRVDGCDRSMVNLSCAEFAKGKNPGRIVVGVELKDVRVIRTKKGTQMAFLAGDDGTDCLEDICVFSEALEKHKGLLYTGNCVLLEGKKDRKKGSLTVEKVHQLRERPTSE